jgi:hypothetical protein
VRSLRAGCGSGSRLQRCDENPLLRDRKLRRERARGGKRGPRWVVVAPFWSRYARLFARARTTGCGRRPPFGPTCRRGRRTDPTSGWVEDFHLQATEHVQHTTETAIERGVGKVEIELRFPAERVRLVPRPLVAATLLRAAFVSGVSRNDITSVFPAYSPFGARPRPIHKAPLFDLQLVVLTDPAVKP